MRVHGTDSRHATSTVNITAGSSGPSRRSAESVARGRLPQAAHRGGGDDAAIDVAAIGLSGVDRDLIHRPAIGLWCRSGLGEEVVEPSGEVAFEAAQRAFGGLAFG